jgi:DNA-binding MarR family transcriptional regulator
VTSTAELSSDLVVYAARLVRALRRINDLPAGFRVLSLLDEHGPLGISALAAADRCSQPTMSEAVRQLAERNLVDKQPNPADARGSVVTLTATGVSELARVRRTNGETVAARWQGRHSADDIAITVAVLRDLLDTIDTDPESRTL